MSWVLSVSLESERESKRSLMIARTLVRTKSVLPVSRTCDFSCVGVVCVMPFDPLPWHGGRKETKENMAIVPDDLFKEC